MFDRTRRRDGIARGRRARLPQAVELLEGRLLPSARILLDVGVGPVDVEPAAVGAPLFDMPLFLRRGVYVPAPLETTYQTTWDEFFPAAMQRLLEAPSPESRR